jgi:hypothetical protein
MASQEYISLETGKPLMKLRVFGFGTSDAVAITEANVTLRIPASQRQLKTSNVHISRLRRGYISDHAAATEHDDSI